jgi:hypothetical protein
MDPVTGLIFVLGVLWAARGSGRAVARSHRKHRANARKTATTHGTAKNRAGSGRRVANAATIGYWANEVRHGLPDIKHGWAQGWREHQLAVAQRETDTAQHKADHQGLLNDLRAQAAAHQHRLEVAAAKYRAGPPTMTEQLQAVPPHTLRQPMGDPVGDDPPLADGKTAGNGSPRQNGHNPMTCRNPGCECHQNQPSPAPAGNGSAPPSGGSVDFNYEQSVKTSDDLIAAADGAVNDELLTSAVGLADGLGAMVPDDGTTNGIAADVVTAVKDVQEAYQRLQDSAAAMKERLTSTYGPTHEDVQASGERAAQPEFHDA